MAGQGNGFLTKSQEISLLAEEKLDEGEISDWPSPPSSSSQEASQNQKIQTSSQQTPINTSKVTRSSFLSPRLQNIEEQLSNDEKLVEQILKVLEQLPPHKIAEKIKHIEDWSYSLAVEEAKQMERGKKLNILGESKTPTKVAHQFQGQDSLPSSQK